jgi:hypothetical protein
VTRLLVHQNFRYTNGQVADHEDVLVVGRGSLTPVALYATVFGEVQLSNPIFTDESGNVSFYLDPGSYDYVVNGARVPFDLFEGSGGGTNLYLQHDQDVPIATWAILHAFGRHPMVTILDDGNEMIMTDLEYPDLATVVATFPAPTTGKAILQA